MPTGPDPFNTLVGVLETLREDEVAGLQFLLMPCQSLWAELLIEACMDDLTGAPIVKETNVATLASQKTKLPLFALVIRALCQV